MRLSATNKESQIINSKFKIIAIDDEQGIITTLQFLFEKFGYSFEGYTSHIEAIEKLKNNHYDLLILDYLLDNIKGNQVVEIVRKFDKDLYILLLTGHSESVPPIETLENNNIQGYCSKSEDLSQLLLLVKSAFKSVEMMNEIRITRDGLSNILKSVPKIYKLQPIDLIMDEILVNLLPVVHAENAFIIVDNIHGFEGAENESFYKGIGKFDSDAEKFVEMFNPLLMEYAGEARSKLMTIQQENEVFIPLFDELRQSMGVLYVENTNTDKLQILEIFASQAASSISNAFLHSLVNIKNEELKKTYEIIKTRYEETIDTLRLTVDAKDEYTRGHSERVAEFAVATGKALGTISDDELNMLRIGGVFHDIGKIGTADDILLSDKKLSNYEFNEIKKHPVTGANILSALSMFRDVVPLVLCHHERIDGKGYPNNLKGDEIPLLARILSVADSFDAMTTNRSYRPKLELAHSIEQLKSGAGTQFDSNVVEVFIKLIENGTIKTFE